MATEEINGTEGAHAPAVRPRTANERLKDSFSSWFWGSVAAAAVLHFAFMAFWPTMQADDAGIIAHELEALELPPEVEIPPPPEDIPRPAVPVIGDVDLDDDITIPETTFEDRSVEDLPPPPTGNGGAGDGPAFTPYEVAPEIRNRAEFQRLLQRNYPRSLQDAGIGGTVVLWLHVDRQGNVQDARVEQSSGQERLDQAAISVVNQVRFSPALNRDERVAVWVQFPVTFQVN